MLQTPSRDDVERGDENLAGRRSLVAVSFPTFRDSDLVVR